jgi:hypothetical protein
MGVSGKVQGSLAGARVEHPESAALEVALDQPDCIGVVVDDQHRRNLGGGQA